MCRPENPAGRRAGLWAEALDLTSSSSQARLAALSSRWSVFGSFLATPSSPEARFIKNRNEVEFSEANRACELDAVKK